MTTTPTTGTKMPEALRLADELCEEIEGYPAPTVLEKKAADKLRQQHAALEEWARKTAWVQETLQPRELGIHYADILRERLHPTRNMDAPTAPQAGAESYPPMLYASSEQLDGLLSCPDPDEGHGRYLPVRVTSAGKFTRPLYATAALRARGAESSDAEQAALGDKRCQACIDRRDGFYGSYAPACPVHDDDGNLRAAPQAPAAPMSAEPAPPHRA